MTGSEAFLSWIGCMHDTYSVYGRLPVPCCCFAADVFCRLAAGPSPFLAFSPGAFLAFSPAGFFGLSAGAFLARLGAGLGDSSPAIALICCQRAAIGATAPCRAAAPVLRPFKPYQAGRCKACTVRCTAVQFSYRQHLAVAMRRVRSWKRSQFA